LIRCIPAYGTTGGIDPFNSAIDEFRVYNRVLSEAEVAALYTQPTSVDHKIASPISNFILFQNYPNPFNLPFLLIQSSAHILYDVESTVRLHFRSSMRILFSIFPYYAEKILFEQC
jgi:hypothetical protein